MKLLFNSLPANCGGQRLLKEIKGKDSTEEVCFTDIRRLLLAVRGQVTILLTSDWLRP